MKKAIIEKRSKWYWIVEIDNNGRKLEGIEGYLKKSIATQKAKEFDYKIVK